jgi:hypothetical protein
VDGAGLAAFRIFFGALMAVAVLRFAAHGWIDELYVTPAYHFPYAGFEWVVPWPRWGMYLHFAVIGLSALCLALGLYTRRAALLFCIAFTYAELLDKAAYLNHYYLVSLLAVLLVAVPASALWSLDARRRGARSARQSATVPAWSYWLLRAQVGIVYLFAGIAKLDADWLLAAQPLTTWLQTFADAPVVGPLLAEPWLARGMSWAGAFFDLTIAGFLSWRRTRAVACAAAVAFHLTVWLLFPIGMFSWIMLAALSVFFAPSWPRRWLAPGHRDLAPAPAQLARRPLPRWGLPLALTYLLLQCLLPLRHLAYPGPVNWTEEGFRFAWRVMLIEKTGQVEYEVRSTGPARRFRVYPRRELTPLQYRMLSTQPDMIQDYALHLARRYRHAGLRDVRVHAHAWASLNGRPAQRLIDPAVDLAAAPRTLAPARWIVPLAASAP